MKCLSFLPLALMACLFVPSPANARIGESRSAFEGRLFSNGGIVYRDKEERNTRRKSGPYSSYLEYLGGSAELRIYFKSDDGRQPTQSDIEKDTLGSGWEVHVLFVGGKSVLELYKRVGSITEQETNALLALLGAGNYWEKTEKPQKPATSGAAPGEEEEEEDPSAFGFEYVRSDGNVRAKKSSGGLMIFQRQLDEYLAKQHKSRLNKSAPQSVQGF